MKDCDEGDGSRLFVLLFFHYDQHYQYTGIRESHETVCAFIQDKLLIVHKRLSHVTEYSIALCVKYG